MRHIVEHTCCRKQPIKRGFWSPEEDRKLVHYITAHGHGSWSSLPDRAGLKRCGKSCRLRWMNYLRPGIKRGNFSKEEEKIIIFLHKIMDNRWARIAKHLPGRTDSEIKNYWNSYLKKKLKASCNDQGLSDVSESSYSTILKHLDMHGNITVEDDHHIVNNCTYNIAKDSNGFIQCGPVELELCPGNSRISAHTFPVQLQAQQTMSSTAGTSWTNCNDEDLNQLIADAMPKYPILQNSIFQLQDAACSSQHGHGMISFSANDHNGYINVPRLAFDIPYVNSMWQSSCSSSNQIEKNDTLSAVIESAYNMFLPNVPRIDQLLQ